MQSPKQICRRARVQFSLLLNRLAFISNYNRKVDKPAAKESMSLFLSCYSVCSFGLGFKCSLSPCLSLSLSLSLPTAPSISMLLAITCSCSIWHYLFCSPRGILGSSFTVYPTSQIMEYFTTQPFFF